MIFLQGEAGGRVPPELRGTQIDLALPHRPARTALRPLRPRGGRGPRASQGAADLLPGDAGVAGDLGGVPAGAGRVPQRPALVEAEGSRALALLRHEPALVRGRPRRQGVEVPLRGGLHLQRGGEGREPG